MIWPFHSVFVTMLRMQSIIVNVMQGSPVYMLVIVTQSQFNDDMNGISRMRKVDDEGSSR